jgi:hypothetical protein
MKDNTIKIIILFLFFVILINLLLHNNPVSENREGFTSGIFGVYRSYLRNVRLSAEGYYKNITSRLKLFFRKFGLI